MQAPTLRCRGLRVNLGHRAVLDGVDLEISRGESVAIMGPSGSGKTTLLNCFAGIRRPDDGEVVSYGVLISGLSDRDRSRFRLDNVGFIFQFGELFDELSVLENVELPLRLRHQEHSTEIASEALARVEMLERAHSWPGELSGGEVQRVAVARAVASRPVLILADEPTGSLDEDLTFLVCDLLKELTNDLGATLVVATHDPEVAATMGRSLRLRRGKLEPI